MACSCLSCYADVIVVELNKKCRNEAHVPGPVKCGRQHCESRQQKQEWTITIGRLHLFWSNMLLDTHMSKVVKIRG